MYTLILKWVTCFKKEEIPISLKKNQTFNDLLQKNRQSILEDKRLMEKIEERIEAKHKHIQQKNA